MSSKLIRNLIVVAAGIAGTGYLRMPLEQKFTEDLRERKIVQPRISAESWSRMGQTSLAGAFGGLRSVMASMLSLQAHEDFEDQDWPALERKYDLITTLEPYNTFYWSHGGWHLAYNGAAWAKTNRDFSPVRRLALEKEFLEKGNAFYERGLEFMPEDEELWFERGAMWSNRYKRPDLPRAAESLKKAASFGNPVYQRRYLYVIARIPGREIEAYDGAQKLLMQSPRHLRVPSFRCLFFILSTNPALPEDALRPKLGEIFRTKEQAYRELYNYRQRVLEENFYAGQIDEVMKELIEELKVPDQWNPFKTRTTRRIHDNDYLRKEDEPKMIMPGWMLKKESLKKNPLGGSQ